MPKFHATRVFRAAAKSEYRLNAVISCADGKDRNLGRIDRKAFGIYWTPRVWFYRYVTYPRLARQFPHLAPQKPGGTTA